MASRNNPITHTSGRHRTRLAVTLLLVALAGCAAQRTFNQGAEMVEQGNVEQGLDKMQQAGKMDPEQVTFRSKYFETRDNAVQGYLVQADRCLETRHYQDAENLYRRVLGLDHANERAHDGLKKLAMLQHHEQLLTEADGLMQSGQIDAVRERLATVLTEDPANERALAMQGTINAQTDHLGRVASLEAMYKKPITLQFRDASLKQIFDVISQSSGLNFVFDKDVKTDQRTSIFLKGSTVEAAVYYTLLTNQLDQQVMDGNTVLIYPNTVTKQKDYQELIVKSFYLTNADAKSVATTLKTILKVRDVAVDEKLNMLVMRDSPEAIHLAEKLIALHDVAEPEVMMDVAILEVNRSKLQDLGVQWPASLTLAPLPTLASGAGNVLSDLAHLNNGNVGIGNPSATVNAHSTNTDANILANPRIRARNHEKAKIMIGDRVPNITVNTAPTTTSYISETITYLDVGLKLDVEPTVYLDDEVSIKLSMEVSNIVSQLVTKSGSMAYQLGTRNASTVLRLKDGETQVLAGLLDDEERHTLNQLPALGEIPILGKLFGSTNDNIQKTEIVLLITPHVIRNIHRPDASSAQFSSGTETNLRLRPDAAAAGTPTGAATPMQPKRPPAVAPSSAQPVVEAPVAGPPAPTDQNDGDAAPTGTPSDSNQNNGAPVKLSMAGLTTTKVGSRFVVMVTARAGEPVANLPLTLDFDGNLFKVESVTEGDFLKQAGAQSSFTSQIDGRGQVLINASATGATAGAADVSGTVATIALRSLAATTGSSIHIDSAAPLNGAGRPMPVNTDAAIVVRSAP